MGCASSLAAHASASQPLTSHGRAPGVATQGKRHGSARANEKAASVVQAPEEETHDDETALPHVAEKKVKKPQDGVTSVAEPPNPDLMWNPE